MGLLDSKTRILDVVLTDKGRSEMSRNNLNFVYYAFSDVGIDYSGSLDASREKGVELDDYLHRNLAFEAVSYKSSRNFSQNADLPSFLYTIPPDFEVLPEVTTSHDGRGDLSLSRSFLIDQLVLSTRKRNRIRTPIAAVLRGAALAKTKESRVLSYVTRQKIVDTLDRRARGLPILGRTIAKDYIVISGDRALNTRDGSVITVDDALEIEAARGGLNESIVSTKKEVEVILGLGHTDIQVQLKTSNGKRPIRSGFLIEVFESGSDGSLTKLARENVTNPLNDDEIEKGFQDFLELLPDRKRFDAPQKPKGYYGKREVER